MEYVSWDAYETLFFILKDERKVKYLTKRSEKHTEYNGTKLANLGYYVMKSLYTHWSHGTAGVAKYIRLWSIGYDREVWKCMQNFGG
jgi:hypothetical protein